MSSLRKHVALGAILTSVVLWGSAFVGIRAAGNWLSPGALALGRLLIALTALIAAWLTVREPIPSRSDLRAAAPALLPCAVLWFGVYNLALNAAERHVDAGTASMVVYISPLLIAVLAGVFLHEGLPRTLFVGCAVSFVGVALIALASSSRSIVKGAASASTGGVLLCLVAAATLATGAVMQKVVLRLLSGLQTITLCCAIGVAVLLPFVSALAKELGRAPAGALLWTVYLGVFPTAIGFLTWAFALARSGAARLGVTTYLVPASSVLLAWLLLGETPSVLALAGGALCLVGVALSRGRLPRRLGSGASELNEPATHEPTLREHATE